MVNGMRARGWGVSTAMTFLATASASAADPASDAKDLFDRGRELRSAGDCAGALPLFHKAFEVYPSALGSLRNAAECEESTGRWASARKSWLNLKRAVMLTQDSKYAGWDRDADEAARRVAPRIAKLVVDVSTGGHHNDWVEVTINGEPLPRALVGTTLERDPGKYDVKARLGEGEPAEQSVDLVTGESRTVHLVVAPAGQPLPKQVRESSPSGWTPAGWVTLSVGLATLAGMVVAIGVRAEALTTISQNCNYALTCDPMWEPTYNRGVTASTAATVLAVAGGALTGAGVLMLVLGATQGPHREHVSLVASPFGVGLVGSFQ